MKKMNPEVKVKWLEALKSGKYLQGVGNLKIVTPDEKMKHCCLGVLCEVYLQETGHGEWQRHCDNGQARLFITDKEESIIGRSATHLPKAVQEWSGLDRFGTFDSDGPDPELEGRTSLVSVNDGMIRDEFKFPILAIERYL